jgi:hypothetical protein|tara:strand:+ start:25231 stop:26556 length:1326 start_codon:yes stop_codon:yes gene_type:complete
MFKSKRDLFKWLLVILTLLFVPYGAVLTILIFCLLYFRGSLANLDLLLLYFLVFFVQNATGGSGENNLSNLRYLLIFIILLSRVKGFSFLIIFSKGSFIPILFLFLLIHSLFFSYDSVNSLIELASFSLMIFFTFKSSFFKSIEQRATIIKNIEAMYIAIIICSAFSFLQPSIAYLKNGVGFQGVSLHPNAFGVVLAPFTGFLLIKLFKKFTKKGLLFFILSFIFTYLSLSRTSILSVLLGLIGIILINTKLRKLISKKFFLFFSLSSILLFLYYSEITQFTIDFLNKSNANTVQDSFIASRGALLHSQITNISNHPFLGIGFKMPSDLNSFKDPMTLGKAYEKGSILLASIEELGIIGAVILLITIISFLKIRKNKYNSFLILALIALFTNLGEATLFSVGGIGVLVWTFIFLCTHNGFLEEKLDKPNKNLNLCQSPTNK